MFNVYNKEDILKDFIAHTKGSRSEPFLDHCRLTAYYRDEMIRIYGLKPVIIDLLTDLGTGAHLYPFIMTMIEFHDLGKLSASFQDKIKHNKRDTRVTHSDKGYFLTLYWLIHDHNLSSKELILVFITAYSIYRHHGALLDIFKDIAGFGTRFHELKDEIREILEFLGVSIDDNLFTLLGDESFYIRYITYIKPSSKKNYLRDTLIRNESTLFLLVKLCHSLLIAADYYATYDFMNETQFELVFLNEDIIRQVRERFRSQVHPDDDTSFTNFNVGIEEKRGALKEQCTRMETVTDINTLRSMINVMAEDGLAAHMDGDERVYFLNVPTGGGKTNISLRLALTIMEHKPIKHVFYVFPFINIIEQSYACLRHYIHEEEMIRLDSKYIELKEKYEESNRCIADQYLDNLFFNYPFLFLSHIRFFDMLLRNDKNSNFNFNKLANSIVIIDEIQAYDDETWTMLSHLFKVCSRYLHTHFIVMSATLPKLGTLVGKDYVHLLDKTFEEQLFAHPIFHDRTQIAMHNTITTVADLPYLTAEADKILVVVNTVKDSYLLYRSMKDNQHFKGYTVLLLNSTLLDTRRKVVISQCNLLDKVLLISTQSIEAGVDVDFDIGFRAYSPFDSMRQTEGRVNRNNTKQNAFLYIMDDIKWSNVYRGSYKANTAGEMKRRILSEPLQDANTIMDTYYDTVIKKIKKDNDTSIVTSGSSYIKSLNDLKLSTIDKEVRLIKGDTISILIPIDIKKETVSPGVLDIINNYFPFINHDEYLSGKKAWDYYIQLVENKTGFNDVLMIRFFQKILVLFSIHVFNGYIKDTNTPLRTYLEGQDKLIYGYYYLDEYTACYDLESGLNVEAFHEIIQYSKAVFL